MSERPSTYPVIIVGGGPVGLFLAACLHNLDIACIVLEKRPKPRPGSRSLGIHPVSLELFQQLGIAENLVHNGVTISIGHAFTNTGKIGSLSFEHCPRPFNFVLSLPQVQTERLLEEHVENAAGTEFVREADVTAIDWESDGVTISFDHKGTLQKLRGRYLVGCDGKNSTVRQKAGISFRGESYPDTYIMGDFADNTDLGTDAAIYLCKEGLIESFPLPEGKRRWVVKTDSYHSSVSTGKIKKRIFGRIKHRIGDNEPVMLSSFGVQRYVADPMVMERVILAGDAAHIVSPIGGQGMNLGWLGAWDLAHTLGRALNEDGNNAELFGRFEERRKKTVRNAIRRAELNMRLGRKGSYPWVRNQIVSLMLNTPLSRLMARLFTMRGIERWGI